MLANVLTSSRRSYSVSGYRSRGSILEIVHCISYLDSGPLRSTSIKVDNMHCPLDRFLDMSWNMCWNICWWHRDISLPTSTKELLNAWQCKAPIKLYSAYTVTVLRIAYTQRKVVRYCDLCMSIRLTPWVHDKKSSNSDHTINLQALTRKGEGV